MRPSPSAPRPEHGLLSHLPGRQHAPADLRVRPQRAPWELRKTFLRTISWLLALFGALCLGLTAWGIAVGATPLIVKTGSMRPKFPVGTVVIVRPEAATSVGVGDVVAIRRSDGKRIMHRVRSIRAAGGGAVTFVVKGDRNRADDPPLTTTRVEAPIFAVPWLAAPINWFKNPWMQYWLGVLTGAVALGWLLERRRRGSGAQAPAQEAS
ncbi:signal peptidase I [Conexibacter sp. JD483]|uniref:signal peptidase I n=1 Tax=unclassified Conexibacter TaxID=2627773 RepID=UPI002716C3F0|nr:MULTISPECIES: signal peptidase I [unclassified Conexibacter]MDO8183997.1 signal peptidase I [Conexibacter sp. CPCC 205706]MDO8196989.1 signal peptidase I [Conexibacter sp. CPCC 205762]MDR9369041.1 signal peptidase I [Conexibacter sp. JD483]